MAFAIMCSGGDAAGMNPAIKKFVDYTYKLGIDTYFIYEGLEGLIDNKIKKADHKDVAGIVHIGGTIIRSSRSKRFFEYKYRKQAFDNIKLNNINGIVVLGGDGSFRAMEKFSSEFDINFVGIPSTIDNDIYGTEYCLGVDTALNVIRDALDKIRDTASSFNRAFIVEVMGRDSGFLAVVSSMISGAEICVIPELEFSGNKLEKRLTKEIKEGRRYVLAIVSEGTHKTSFMKEWIQEKLDLQTRVTILGHVQRGGNPTVYDRMMAFDFIINAVDYLKRHKNSNKVVVYNKGVYNFMDIQEIVSNKYKLPEHYINAINYLD
ncbi:MAG: 6-phosphofructokinase [Sulfurimonas sp.]